VKQRIVERNTNHTISLGQSARDAQKGFDMAYFGDPRYIGWGGGLPVVVEGAVVGAVAVSGLPEQEDMELGADRPGGHRGIN
jgi:glc operon protein GlcG